MFMDRQVAVGAQIDYTIQSNLLDELKRIEWVLGLSGFLGKEKVDTIARKGLEQVPLGQSPYLVSASARPNLSSIGRILGNRHILY